MSHPAILRRTELMLGTAMLDTLKATNVAVIVLQDIEKKLTSR